MLRYKYIALDAAGIAPIPIPVICSFRLRFRSFEAAGLSLQIVSPAQRTPGSAQTAELIDLVFKEPRGAFESMADLLWPCIACFDVQRAFCYVVIQASFFCLAGIGVSEMRGIFPMLATKQSPPTIEDERKILLLASSGSIFSIVV